jgi:hypothetical protein
LDTHPLTPALTTYAHPHAFEQTVRGQLEAQEAENGLMLGFLARPVRQAPGEHRLARARRADEHQGVGGRGQTAVMT